MIGVLKLKIKNDLTHCSLIGQYSFHCSKKAFKAHSSEGGERPLKMKNFVFIETNHTFSQGSLFAKKSGYKTILFTYIRLFNPGYYSIEELNVFDLIYDVDTHSCHSMFQLVKRKNIQVAGILSCYDDTVLQAALLAQKLLLPHPSIKGLKNTFSKSNVRKILNNSNFKQIKHVVVNLQTPLKNLPMPLPFIIKPDHDSGSDGAKLCKNKEDYSLYLKELKAKPFTFSGLIREQLITEEFVPGVLYGSDFLWYKNSWKLIGITQQILNPSKGLCLVGMVFQADIPKKIFESIKDEILSWITSLNLKGGAVNVEFKILNNKPILIEINPRLPWCNVNRLITLACKFSPIEFLIRQACNLKNNLDEVKLNSELYFCDIYIFPPAIGKIHHIDISQVPKVHLAQIELKKTPLNITHTEQILENVIGHVIASGKNIRSSIHNTKNVVDKIQINYGSD